jgi:hypothetical protein
MSIFPAVAVIVGAPAVPHLTPVKVAVPLPVEAACFKSKMKDLPAVAVGMVNVQAVEAVSVAVMTVPDVIEMVEVVVTVPIAVTASVYAAIVGLTTDPAKVADKSVPSVRAVEPLDCSANTPLVSAVVLTPEEPDTTPLSALIVLGMISPYA